MLFESLPERRFIIVWNYNRLRGEVCGHARAVGRPERSEPGAAFDKQAVGMAVITASNLTTRSRPVNPAQASMRSS